MSSDKTPTLSLSLFKGSMLILRDCLASPGWYAEKPAALVLAAGALLESEALTEMGDPRTQAEKDDGKEPPKAWLDTVGTWDVTAKQRDAVKAAFEFHLKKGAFRPSKFINRIITQLEIAVE